MKAAELLECAVCNVCRKPIGSTGLPLFWRVSIERFGIDMQAVKRADGLAAMMGSARLAAAMGPDEDMALPMMEKRTLTVCEKCAMESHPVAVLAESNA